jgi:uncharacterized phage infection (PIP) family protein YhgE
MELTVNLNGTIHIHHHHGADAATLARIERKVDQAVAQGATLMSAVDQINTYLASVNADTTRLSQAATSQASSISNIAADIQRLANSDLPPAVQNQLAAHAEALKTAADGATAQAQALADLAAVTPEPAPEPVPVPEPEPVPVEPPVTEPPAEPVQ